MKKIMFVLCMVVSMSIPCFAESFSAVNDDGISITYQVTSDGTVSVVRGESSYVGKVIVPDSVWYNGDWYGVKEIKEYAFQSCTNLEYVAIPNSVKSIGGGAFENCRNLTSVSIGDSVKTIEYNAFKRTGLKTVVFPNSLEYIGFHAFDGCSNLDSISLGKSLKTIRENVFQNCPKLTKVNVSDINTLFNVEFVNNSSNPLSIAKSLYLNGIKVTELEIPEGITEIPGGLFTGLTCITSICIPSSVNSIAPDAFRDCSNLQSITIPESVTSIGDNAFNGCINLTSVTFSQSLSRLDLGENVFANTAWINNSDDGVIYIGSVLYKYQGAMPDDTVIEVKEGTTSIAEGAFQGCTGLKDIMIPASVIHIGKNAFASTTWYDNKPDGLVYINKVLYKYKGKMAVNTSLEIADETISISEGAFENLSQLTKVILPASLTEIEKSAFSGCSGLTNLTVGDAVATIGDDAFKGCSNLCNIYVSSNERMFAILYGDALSCGEGSSNPFMLAKHIYVDGVEVTELTLPDGMTEINSGFFYNFGKNITSVTIPNSVTTIGDGAFQGWTTLASVTIGNSVTSIGANAFSGCTALTSIELPIPISTIGESAFSGCSNLSTITLGDSVKTIADYAFSGCSGSLRTVNVHKLETMFNIKCGDWTSNPFYIASRLHLNGEEVTNLVIPEGVTEINSGFFYRLGGNVTSVTIPNSVTTIGDGAFQYWSKLASVTIGNSVTSIGDYAFNGCGSLQTVNVHKLETMFNIKCGRWDSNPFYIASKLHLNGEEVTNLVIPEGVKEINSGFFYNFGGNVTSVTIPNSVTTIGDRAFRGWTTLASVTIGDSVLTIGNDAFYDCNNLSIVNVNTLSTIFNIKCGTYVPFSIATKLHLNGKEVTELVIPEGVTEINKGFFYNFGENVTSVTIPNSVKSIGDDAFSHWPKLTTASIGNSVKDIGSRAFYKCAALKSVVLGDSVKTIGGWAFDGTGLTSVTLPSSLESIGYNAFGNCANLEKVNVTSILTLCNIAYNNAESNPLSIANHLFLNDEEVTELVIPEGVTQISHFAFIGARAITSVTIPNTVKVIENRAFGNCTNLSYITLGDSVRTIADYAFLGCSNLQTVNVNKLETMFDIKCGRLHSNPFSIASKLHLNGEEVTNLVIPEGVTQINQGFLYNFGRNVTSVTIPSSAKVGNYAFKNWSKLASISVERLGNNAFEGCSALTSITLGSSVDTIAAGAFRNCTGLESVVIPNTVKVIENRAFEGCTKLSSITLGNAIDSIGEAAFVGCDSLKRVDVTDLDTWYAINFANQSANPLTIAKHLYYNGEEVVGLTIPEGITEINYGYFSGYENITSIVLPSSVVKIGDRAFMNLVNLKSVTLSESLETIGEGAFQNCTSLISVKVPNSVKSLAPYVFSRCTNLESVILSDSLRTIGAGSFHRCGNLKSIVIPNSVVSIGDRVFEFCTNLSYITLGDSVKTIAEYAFNGCDSLQTVNVNKLETMFDIKCDGNWSNPFSKASRLHLNGEEVTNLVIPEGVTEINCGFFYNFGGNVTSVTIPNSVKSIGMDAFQYWTKLGSVAIGNSVTRIGFRAFIGCTALTTIELPIPVSSIGAEAFRGCSNLSTITLGDSVKFIGESAFEGSGLQTVNVNKLETMFNIQYDSREGDPFSKASKLYLNGEEVTNLVIPEGVTEINDGFFYKFGENITSVTIPNSVKSIGGNAFKDWAKLAFVSIGNSVQDIGYRAFENCLALTSVVIGDSVKTIEFDAFKKTGLTSVTFPNSLDFIGYHAFDGCSNLETVSFGDSIKTIQENVFNGCEALAKVNATNIATLCNIAYINATSNPLSIAKHLFLNDVEVTDLVIPEGVTQISQYAFVGAEAITSVTIPNSVKSIGMDAFNGCKSLSYLTLGDSVNNFYSDAFNGCDSLTINVTNLEALFNDFKFDGYQSNPFEIAKHLCVNDEEIVDLVVPNTVKKIYGVVFNGRKIKSLVIPNSVEMIGNNAFRDCVQLESVSLGNSVDTIGASAFANCKALTSIEIPNSVTHLSDYAFYECNSLSSVTLGNSIQTIGAGAFANCKALTSIEIPNSVTHLSGYAFSACNSLSSVTLGNSIQTIGDGAFEYCKALTSIEIPNSVTTISRNAFYDCYGLESVTLGSSIQSIGESAFGYIGLSLEHHTQVNIPSVDWLFKVDVNDNNNDYLFNNMYVGKQPLKALEVPDNVVDAPILPKLYNSCITSLNTGNGLKVLPEGCSWNFTQVTLGNNITEVKGEFPNALIVVSNASKVPAITENTFPKCMFDNGADGVVILQSPSEQNRYAAAKYWEGMQLTNQTNIVDVFVNTPGDLSLEIIEKHRMAIPKVVGLTVRGEINDDDFIQMNKNMKSLLYLDLSEAIVEKVPDNAFDGKQQLLSLKLPNTTKVVGNYAFRGCHGIEDLVLPTDLTEIGDQAFAGTNIVTLDFNYALTKIGNRAFANTPLKEVSFQNKVESIGNEAFQGCNLEQELLFSETLTSIGERAFEGQDGITGHLTIPESVTTVGRNAFSGTNISTVFISSKMTTIESEVFANCPLLDVVYIPDNIIRINASAFQGCTSLKNLRLSQGVEEIEREAFRSIPIKSINVPENIKTLSEYTFADCANLRFVTLPSTITDLGEGVFYNCRQLMNLTVKAITPPTVKANTFRGVNTDRCILSIPTTSYRNYVLAEYWGRFIQMRNDIAVQTKGNGSISFASGETEGEENAPAPVRKATRAATETESTVTTVEDGSSLYVPKDGTVRFYITPAEGEKIVSATFDGEDITSQIVGGVFVTTADKQSAKLEVNFSELTKTAQVITWEQNFEPMMVGDKITLNATASSGLVVTYLFGDSESSGYASLNGSTLTIEKPGAIALIAQQKGDNKYASIATDVKYIHAYEYGDADANREINSADLATTIDYVIGHAPQEFLFKAADVNKDKRVNVADVSGVVDIVLTAPATTDKATRTDDMTIGEVLYAELAINSIDFDLSNEKGEFLTFQCDIRLSDDCLPRLDNAGNPVVTIRKSEVQQNTQVAVARLLENGNIRILVYSTENTPIVNNHTLALQLESVSKNSDIEILSGGYSYREDGHIVYHAFDYGFVNGLESKGDVISQMKIKATGNEVLIYSPVDYLLSVSSIDGVVYKLDVKAGYNRFAMNQGVYIIGKNKVIIR